MEEKMISVNKDLQEFGQKEGIRMKRMMAVFSAAIIFGNALSVSPVHAEALSSVGSSGAETQDVSDDLERAYTLLRQYIASQKKSKNPAFQLARAYRQDEKADADGTIPEQFRDKVIVEHSDSWEETFLAAVKDFMEQNQIDENLVVYVVADDRHDQDDLYYFGITGMESFQDMKLLDDKGMFREHAEYVNKWYGTGEKYDIYTREVSYKERQDYVNQYLDEIPDSYIPSYLWATASYMVMPYESRLQFRLRNHQEPESAAEQAALIAQKYFPESESCQHQSDHRDFYVITERDETARSEEKANQMMRELAAAGLISEFYSWGQTAAYREMRNGYLTAYSSYNENYAAWAEKEIDWDGIKAWVEEAHPECECRYIALDETELLLKLGYYDPDKGELKCQEPVFAVLVPEDYTSFKHMNLAMEIYEKFDLEPYLCLTAEESGNETLTGKNSLAVAGDVTLDCSVDVSDAVLLARFCTEDGKAMITDQGRQNADLNADGNLTLEDVTVILRKVAKLD